MCSIRKSVVVLLTVALALGFLPVAPFAAKDAKAADILCTVDLNNDDSLAAAVSGGYIDLTRYDYDYITVLKDGVALTGNSVTTAARA